MEDGKQLKDEKGNLLTLQHKMEKKWHLDPGYLTNRAWRKGDSRKEEDFTYYQRMAWKVNDGATVLDLDQFDDEMFYYVALDSHLIANSEKEWKEHKWPKATHYIALENENEELRFNKNQLKSKAFADLHKDTMTPTIKEKMVAVLELSNSFAKLTQEQVQNLLFDYIDKTTFNPNSNLDKFNALVKLLETPTGREELECKYILKQGIDSRVLYEKQGAYNWARPSGLLVLGEGQAEAMEFLLNPKKQSIVEELREEIKLRTL